MTTLADVAARAGVSVSAVSRVLSDHPSARVSDGTRERIRIAARELDYRPNFAGRALKSARTQVLGLVMPHLTNAVVTDLVDGVEDEARDQGYMLLLSRSGAARPSEEVIARLVGEGRVDGVLLQYGDYAEPADLTGLFNTNAPVTTVDAVVDDRIGSAVLDDAHGARVATEHLLELGHARIGMVSGLPTTYTARRREEGFRETMREAGFAVDPSHVTHLGYRHDQGKLALQQIVDTGNPPTALVVADVDAAIGVVAEARALGVRVPQELSVVSVHDSSNAENTWPPLTTVKMPFYELGRVAVRTLITRLKNGVVVNEVVDDPAPTLVVRESTGRIS